MKSICATPTTILATGEEHMWATQNKFQPTSKKYKLCKRNAIDLWHRQPGHTIVYSYDIAVSITAIWIDFFLVFGCRKFSKNFIHVQ